VHRFKNSARIPELEALLSANVMLRRLKTQIRHEVPDKKRQRVSHLGDTNSTSGDLSPHTRLTFQRVYCDKVSPAA
jgi:hypothetical protein